MKVRTIPSGWMLHDGRRFDCGPYMSGALEAKIRLEEMSCEKDPLQNLTAGHNGGIYNGPHFSRIFVDSPKHGVPFLGSGAMLQADLTDLPLLRRKDAMSPKLSYLRVRYGMTLISCSGTIGRMVYARPDMEGMLTSQHIMKVVPDPEKVPSGYVFAFLSSRYGVPLVTSGTYGSIIQSIEPGHIADLPVPRLGGPVEERAHELVDDAATARAKSAQLKANSRRILLDLLGLRDISATDTPTSFATFVVSSADLRRLDSAHHSPACKSAVQELAQSAPTSRAVSDTGKVFTPGIFKRRHVDNPDYGYPYFSGTELFQIDATPRGHLARKWLGIEEYLVAEDWLLIQDAGQLGGLIGRVVRVPPTVAGGAVSNHLMRIAIGDRETAAYVFAILTSAHGYRAIVRNAFGSSIPQLDPQHIGSIQLPWPNKRARSAVAEQVLQAWQFEDEAIVSERAAITLVERAIEEAA
jgi:type I restriction enzyme, S subunit